MADFNSLKDKLLVNLGKAAKATKDIAEKTADKTKDFAGKAADKTKDIAEKASDKAKAGARIAKLNIEIAGEKDNMKKTYLEIGKLYYDTHKENPEGFFIQLCEEIALAEKNIADKEAEIALLKADDEVEDDSIEVEIEEIVDEECDCACSCKEKVEEVIDKVEDFVEEVAEKIEDKFDD